MSDRRTTVETDPDDPTKVKIVIQGLSCSIFSILSQEEAFVLMKQIARHLLEKEDQ